MLLGACATPAARFDALAKTRGLQGELIRGESFDQLLYPKAEAGEVLHVYLSGDGTPWRTRYRPARDPTPRHPLVLSLMLLDPAPAVYLGRPCYHGASRGCSVWHWTAGRYSRAVVLSMAGALDAWLADHPTRALVLIGYSGGGSLAMLLADVWEDRRRLGEALPPISDVVTIAANLDIHLWTERHDYSPLTGSLNPAQVRLPASLRQWHLVGERDENVPPELVMAALAKQSSVELLRYPGADHHCCWEGIWREFLRANGVALGTPSASR